MRQLRAVLSVVALAGLTAACVAIGSAGAADIKVSGGGAPQPLGPTDSPTFAGMTINGKLTVTGAIDPTSLSLSGSTALYFESDDGSTAAVAPLNKGRIRYLNGTGWQVSASTGAWTTLATGSSPWTSDAANRMVMGTAALRQVWFGNATSVTGGGNQYALQVASATTFGHNLIIQGSTGSSTIGGEMQILGGTGSGCEGGPLILRSGRGAPSGSAIFGSHDTNAAGASGTTTITTGNTSSGNSGGIIIQTGTPGGGGTYGYIYMASDTRTFGMGPGLGGIELTTSGRVKIYDSGSVVMCDTGALATNATTGFTYLPTCAGAPSGVPETLAGGGSAVVVDTTNNTLNFRSGGAWQSLAAGGATYPVAPASGTATATAGTHRFAAGPSSSAGSNNATAIGDTATVGASSAASTALGYQATITATLGANTALGSGAYIHGSTSASTAVGYGASVGASSCVALGHGSAASDDESGNGRNVVIGAGGAYAVGCDDSVAVGYGASAPSGCTGSVALGSGAQATASGQFIFGSAGHQITSFVAGNGTTGTCGLGTASNAFSILYVTGGVESGTANQSLTFNGTDTIINAPSGSTLSFVKNGNSAAGGYTTFSLNTGGDVVVFTDSGNVRLHSNDALATGATDGFTYLPSCAGNPNGTPTTYGATVPMVVDSSTPRLYVYVGGAWKYATLN